MNKIKDALLVIALIAVAALSYMNMSYKASAIESAFVRDSLEAELDTQRVVIAGLRTYVTARAVQHKLEVDDLNKKLKSASAVRAQLELSMAELLDSLIVEADSDEVECVDEIDCLEDEDIKFTIDRYNEPYSLHASILVNTYEQTLNMDYSIKTDPIGLNVRVECGAPKQDGIRPAILAVETQRFFNARIVDVVQNPEVCNAKTVLQPTPSARRNLTYYALGVASTIGAIVVFRQLIP